MLDNLKRDLAGLGKVVTTDCLEAKFRSSVGDDELQ
jgi:hypothetical protein